MASSFKRATVVKKALSSQVGCAKSMKEVSVAEVLVIVSLFAGTSHSLDVAEVKSEGGFLSFVLK